MLQKPASGSAAPLQGTREPGPAGSPAHLRGKSGHRGGRESSEAYYESWEACYESRGTTGSGSIACGSPEASAHTAEPRLQP